MNGIKVTNLSENEIEQICRAIVKNLGGLRGGIQFLKRIAKGGTTYEDTLKKKKIPYMNLAMLVVRKEYQGQGYMRQLMEMVYEIADEKNLAVILDTDAEDKVERYEHLGMELVKTRDLGEGVFLYDLYRASSFL